MWIQKISAVLLTGAVLLANAGLTAAAEASAPDTYEDGMFTFAYTDDGVELYSVDISAFSVTIPDETDGRKIVGIADSAFYGCESLTTVTIGANVRSIGNNAFAGCTSLKNLEIPDTVASIGKNAFSGCTALTTLHIPENLTEIPEGMCYYCPLLEEVNFPDSLKSIGTEAFYNCLMLPAPVLPEGLEKLGDYAFAFCGNLEQAVLPSTVTSLGSAVYCGCDGLTEFTVPKQLESMGSLVFLGCTGMQSFSVEDGNTVYTAADGILYMENGTVLTAYPAGRSDSAFTVPEGVTTIYDAAFFRAEHLQSVEFPGSLQKIGAGAFEYCTGLQHVTIPEGVSIIYENAFADCTALTSVTFPQSLKSVGSYAFYTCPKLMEVTVPSGCNMGDYAFGYQDGTETDENGKTIPVRVSGFKLRTAGVKLSTILLVLGGVCLFAVIAGFLIRVIRKNQMTDEESELLKDQQEADEDYTGITDGTDED